MTESVTSLSRSRFRTHEETWDDATSVDGDLRYKTGAVWLGVAIDPEDDDTIEALKRDPASSVARSRGAPAGWTDDRHLITVAGSRAGKGTSLIVPNLKLYPGSIVCIDPKGENATATSQWRQNKLGQDVFVLDPFKVSSVPDELRARCNPIAELRADSSDIVDECDSISENLFIGDAGNNQHFEESARRLVSLLMMFAIAARSLMTEEPSLVSVKNLLDGDVRSVFNNTRLVWPPAYRPAQSSGPISIRRTLELIADAPDHLGSRPLMRVARNRARSFIETPAREFGSIVSFAQRNLAFLEGEFQEWAMGQKRVGHRRTRYFSIENFAKNPRGTTVYLCLPTRHLPTHARWLRVMISEIFAQFEKQTGPNKSQPEHRTLCILDEFPVLGNMRSLENAVGYLAGFGLKVWAIMQDLSQLKRCYPESWETFIGNAGVCTFWANNDSTTTDYIENRLGELVLLLTLQSGQETYTTVERRPSSREREDHRRSSGAALVDEDFFIGEQENRAEGSSYSEALERRPLIRSAEAAVRYGREKRTMLVLCEGRHPTEIQRIEDRGEKEMERFWLSIIGDS